jgi:hypothetical protein
MTKCVVCGKDLSDGLHVCGDCLGSAETERDEHGHHRAWFQPRINTRVRAERLWEQIGGSLCLCQRPDVVHWCEDCQRRIDIIQAEIGL